ncbi:hypothetical protein GK091_25565 [Spirosoma agri]|uniref:Pesticidal crystal protein domain-containing protein n=1 Tax=Spirosoma agri TaxID=1987381 RepID=A0A6M0IS87_9BACT|nr:insecticidal delta-endotoxin Cry8Ea1 family protein [Spirosoma agri]NEU70271.1 hypothetical protein [Spirosoma agri]
MLLPKNLTNRRKFLERTALGAGSMLFLPELLTSCNDHRIPDPGTSAGIPPLVGDNSFDYNGEAKTVIVTGLRFIPEVGGILSALVSIFWPGTDVWSKVKNQVEALVDQKIDDAVISLVQAKLTSLKTILDNYTQEIKDGATGEKMYSNWGRAQDFLSGSVGPFSASGFEVVLLPFYAQLANMHLSVQRDVVIAGKSWGRSETERATDIKNLQTYINDHLSYVQTTYAAQVAELTVNTRPNTIRLIEPFTTVNRYTRETTLTVLDYAKFWPYYDVTKYPNGAKVSLPRELYSDPVGSEGKYSGFINLPTPPTQGPTELTVWGSTDGVDAVQLTYPSGSGPDGVTTTPRRGRQDGGGHGSSGTTDQPYGLILRIATDNPLVRARMSTNFVSNSPKWYGVYTMQFGLHDGTIINKVGADDTSLQADWVEINDHFISSIYINGSLEDDQGIPSIADCVVIGFKYLTGGPSVTSRTLERLYVTNPRELSGTDLAQVSPTFGATAVLITDNLKAARQAYWAAIAQANEPR